MDDRVLQFRVGFVMLVAMLLTGILFFLLGEQPQFLSDKETVYVVFDTAPGVTIDTPVRTSGILIGRVSNVKLQDDRKVLVTLKVEQEYMPHENEVCRIVSESLLGDAALEFVPTDRPGLPNQPLPDGAKINGSVASNPLKVLVNLEDSLLSAIATLEDAGSNVSRFAANANRLIEENDDQVGRIMVKTEGALDRFDSALAGVQNLVGDQELNNQLKEALEGLPVTIQESRKLIDQLRVVAGRADRNLENLEGFTEPLGERGEQLVANLENSTENLNILVAQLAQFGRKVNESEGSLGQLINDPHLYQNLNDAAANIRELSVRLRPIVEDARVFVDKIARDPGRIGVKGALNRNQSGIK
ncbi:MlaD family protein [Bremerella cremea]|uniref:MlaD family protein n=1 Tax=Bremerella cremea TaxID=1031537 RepID=UPI0031F1B958